MFDVYKLPAAMIEGTDIALKGTPAVFKVKLPCQANEDFSMKVLMRLTAEGGDVSKGINVVQLQMIRKAIFVEDCILCATGLPDDMDVKTFLFTYQLAGRALFERAMELGREADEEIETAMGNLEPSPVGKSSGEGNTSNTTTSSKQGSSPRQPDQKSAA